MGCVLVHFFSLSLIFTLVAASIPPLQNVTLFLQQKNLLLFFPYPSCSFHLVELSLACRPTFFFLSLSLFSKFVDMTINLSLILKATRIHFLLSVFVFIDSLVVSVSRDTGGHTFSHQYNLTFGIALHVVGVQMVV